jgi:hypothetical protein
MLEKFLSNIDWNKVRIKRYPNRIFLCGSSKDKSIRAVLRDNNSQNYKYIFAETAMNWPDAKAFSSDFLELEEYIAELNKLENKMSMMDNHSNDESFVQEMNAERDEMGYAVSWKRALSSLYNETSWLHSYHSINSLAVQKIQKKIIKIFKLYDIETTEILDKISTEYSFFGESLNRLIDLRVRIKKLYSEKFTKGNDLEAKQELEKRLQGGVQENKYHL